MRIAGAKKGQQKFQIFKETTGLCLSICYYSVRFRSNLPVVSNLTAMNMWDATCMFFIYTSFLEFVVMNYLARYEEEEEHTLSRYNMKCSGENEILREILHVVSRFPLHFMLFRGNFDSLSNSEQQCSQNDIDIHCKKSFGGF